MTGPLHITTNATSSFSFFFLLRGAENGEQLTHKSLILGARSEEWEVLGSPLTLCCRCRRKEFFRGMNGHPHILTKKKVELCPLAASEEARV